MNKMVLVTTLALSSLLLVGCMDKNEESKGEEVNFSVIRETEFTTHNPTVEEMFELDPQLDIFLLDNIVYKTNIEWVDELYLTKGDLKGVIETNTSLPNKFINLTANVLPIGTKIYTSNEREDILIAEYDNEMKYYYKLVEG